MEICIILMCIGLILFTIGVIKSIKTRFSDLIALIWIWSGVGVLNIGVTMLNVIL